MVSDGAFLVLAGLTSWGASKCAAPDIPGVYTRLGAAALNSWVRARVPMARARVSDAGVGPGETSRSPSPRTIPAPGPFTDFAWDFDSNGTADAGPRRLGRPRVSGGGALRRARDGRPARAPTPRPTRSQSRSAIPAPARADARPTPEPTPVPTVQPTPQPRPEPLPSAPLAAPAAARR